MPAITIPYQPATGHLLAAYRPLVLKVIATATGGGPVPPFVSCDIYIADIYYKSIIRTAAESQDLDGSTWQFDIQDALQEYLQPDIAQIDNDNILQAPHMSAKVFCRFRASDLDENGFTVEEPTKPVQATRFTLAEPGTGLQSNTFFVINASLQHEDNQNLVSHLNAYKQGEWDANAFPLTHRNRYFFCPGDSDHFPFAFRGDCISTDMKLFYRLRGESDFTEATAINVNVCDAIDYDVEVTANQVDVTLDDALAEGESVLVQYKKQADSVWITAGTYTVQNFSFNINGENIAGDYDIRVIRFCTPCLSANPIEKEFELDGEEVNLAWRGINPFCVVSTLDTPIYVQLEHRNVDIETVWFPSEADPEQRVQNTTVELWAKFFTNSTFVTPLSVTEVDLKIPVKVIQNITDYNGSDEYTRTSEQVGTYTVSPSGVTEILLGTVVVQNINENFSTYPTVSSSTQSDYDYVPYPTEQLAGGNTGFRGFEDLEEYNTDTNLPTGVTKDNDDGDPDYIAPTANEALCPSGPDVTRINYGYDLQISKVQLNYNATSNLYAPTVVDTEAGGWQYVLPAPKNTAITVSVKAKTLDSGNVSGVVKVRVSHNPGGGPTTSTFNVPNDIETTLPGTFKNISLINISNF